MDMTLDLTVEAESTDLLFLPEGQTTIENWVPEEPLNVGISLTITIGLKGRDPRYDVSFETAVWTEAHLRHLEQTDPDYVQSINLKKIILVKEFSWPIINYIIQSTVKECTKDTWESSVDELRKRWYFEYEDDWEIR